MTYTSFEHANLISGQSRISSTKIFLDKNHKHFCNLHYIEIPDSVARKFDLKGGDCLIWNYYHDKKAAIVRKREGWQSRKARMSKESIMK
jgi:hypothetical protein